MQSLQLAEQSTWTRKTKTGEASDPAILPCSTRSHHSHVEAAELPAAAWDDRAREAAFLSTFGKIQMT